MSSDIVSHNVKGILLTLCDSNCEKIVSRDEYPYCYKVLIYTTLNVAQIVERLVLNAKLMNSNVIVIASAIQ